MCHGASAASMGGGACGGASVPQAAAHGGRPHAAATQPSHTHHTHQGHDHVPLCSPWHISMDRSRCCSSELQRMHGSSMRTHASQVHQPKTSTEGGVCFSARGRAVPAHIPGWPHVGSPARFAPLGCTIQLGALAAGLADIELKAG